MHGVQKESMLTKLNRISARSSCFKEGETNHWLTWKNDCSALQESLPSKSRFPDFYLPTAPIFFTFLAAVIHMLDMQMDHQSQLLRRNIQQPLALNKHNFETKWNFFSKTISGNKLWAMRNTPGEFLDWKSIFQILAILNAVRYLK